MVIHYKVNRPADMVGWFLAVCTNLELTDFHEANSLFHFIEWYYL